MNTELVEQEVKDESPEGQLFDLISATIKNISGTNITSSSEMVDVLLDIANLATKIEETANNLTAQYLRSLLCLSFYEEKYGVERPPKGWIASSVVGEQVVNIIGKEG